MKKEDKKNEQADKEFYNKIEKVKIYYKNYKGTNPAEKLNYIEILKEFVCLCKKNGVSVSEYFSMQFYRRDFPKGLKEEFIGKSKYTEILKKICPINNRAVTCNKLFTKSILSFYEIPVPKTLGLLSLGYADSSGQFINSIAGLKKILSDLNIDRCVIKPLVNSAYGKGIKFYYKKGLPEGLSEKVYEDYYISPEVSEEGFMYKIGPREVYLCEEFIEQHDVLSRFNPYSVNTLRVLCLKENNQPKIIGMLLRASQGRAPVDNFTSGGEMYKVDMNNGLLEYGFKKSLILKKIEVPECKKIVIPCLDEVIRISKATCNAMIGLDFLGIDVAVTKNGPIVVEVNSWPCHTAQVKVGVGYRSIFKNKIENDYLFN